MFLINDAVGRRAHVCVSTTAREAHQLGYDVVVAKDAVGDRSIPADGGKEAVSGEQVTQVRSDASPRFSGLN